MVERDTSLTVLSSGIALAGLLLIFSGFLFTKAASYETRLGDKFRLLARATILPVLAALALSWMSVCALEGNQWAMSNLLFSMKILLGITAVFAVIGVIRSS